MQFDKFEGKYIPMKSSPSRPQTYLLLSKVFSDFFIINCVCVCELRALNVRSTLFAKFKYIIQYSVIIFISKSSLWRLLKTMSF